MNPKPHKNRKVRAQPPPLASASLSDSLDPAVLIEEWAKALGAGINPQLKLTDLPVEQKKDFIRQLFASPIEAHRRFDKLDCTVSFARQPDSGMTIASYADAIGPGAYMTFIIRRKLVEIEPARIEVGCSMVYLEGNQKVDYFAWFVAEASTGNLTAMGQIFNKVTGKSLGREFFKAMENLRRK